MKRLGEACRGGKENNHPVHNRVKALPAPASLGLSPSADSAARNQPCIPQETYLHVLAVLVAALGCWRQLGPLVAYLLEEPQPMSGTARMVIDLTSQQGPGKFAAFPKLQPLHMCCVLSV